MIKIMGFRRDKIFMAEEMLDITSRIKDITLKIDFHENRISMHRSAIRKLRNEKSILMNVMKGRDEDGKETR